MKPSLLQSRIETLKTQIIDKNAEYNKAIKDGKEFKTAKKLYMEAKALKTELEFYLKERNRLQTAPPPHRFPGLLNIRMLTQRRNHKPG